MRRYFFSIILLVAALSACNDGDSDLNQLIADYEETLENDIVPMSIAIDDSPLSEPSEFVPTQNDDPEYYNDYLENSTFRHIVNIVYSSAGATVDGNVTGVSAAINGNHVEIISTLTGVEYRLSGNAADGSFKIYSDHRFKIVADGLSLHNPRGAAINSQSGKTMYFVTDAGGATLSDGVDYSTTPIGEDEKGTLFSEGQIVFSGMGKLTVSSQSHNAIASDDYVRFRVGTNISLSTVAGHGVKTNDGVFINGGILNISVAGNGSKGINSEDDIYVSGGRTTIVCDGATRVSSVDTVSVAAIKCDSCLTIQGGELRLLVNGDGSKGINVNQDLTLAGGKVYIVNHGGNDLSKAKGLKVDGNLSVSGGLLYVYSRAGYTLDIAGSRYFAPGYSSFSDRIRLFELIY